MNKTKKRGNAKPTRTDLHAISPLPVDFIVTRLSLLSKRGMVVDIHDYGDDESVFQLKHPKMRSVATGTLRRWEGTHTRIDANTTLQTPPDWIEWVAHFVVIFFFFIWFGGCSVLLGLASIFTFISALVLATILSLLMPISRFFDRYRKQAVIDADRQMQLVALILTSNLPEGTQPLVEFDGTDQSLERMLRQSRIGGK
jgi:hypothetical protein